MGRQNQPLGSSGHTDTLRPAGPSVNMHIPSSVGSLCDQSFVSSMAWPPLPDMVFACQSLMIRYRIICLHVCHGLAALCCFGLLWVRFCLCGLPLTCEREFMRFNACEPTNHNSLTILMVPINSFTLPIWTPR